MVGGDAMMAKRENVSEYIKNMPTSRFIETSLEYINDTNRADLSHIVSRMASVANKRLKRMEEKGIQYSNSEYPDAISGVRKFSAAGKTLGQLRSEYKRLHGFLSSKMSTLTGRVKAYHETKKRIAEKEGREFSESLKESRKEYYEREKVRNSFDSIGSMFAVMRNGNWLAQYGLAGLDSNQIQQTFEEVALEYGEPEYDLSSETWQSMMYEARARLENLVRDIDDFDYEISTSSFI